MELHPLSSAERPPLALKLRENEESDGDAGLRRPLHDGRRFGGEQASPLAVHARHRRPRTAFGISLRAEALHPPFQVTRRRINLSKKPNRTKSVPLTFYVTEADSRRIHQKAEACGVSLTQYLTDCAVGKEIVRIDALSEFTKALKAQGNNLNQLTTLANMGRITAVNVREACALYADIQRSLKALLERTV